MRRWFLLAALFKHEIDVATKADFPLTVCLAEWQSNLGVRAIGRMSVASSNLPPQSRWTALRQLARGPANRLSARLRLRNLSAGAAFQLSLEVALPHRALPPSRPRVGRKMQEAAIALQQKITPVPSTAASRSAFAHLPCVRALIAP